MHADHGDEAAIKYSYFFNSGILIVSFIVKLNLCDHLQSSVTCLWESKNHTDVTFLVCGERVSAHRVILASQSEYFDRLLYGEMKESRQDEIKLQDVSSLQAFQLLIEYAYTGCLTIENGVLQVNSIYSMINTSCGIVHSQKKDGHTTQLNKFTTEFSYGVCVL